MILWLVPTIGYIVFVGLFGVTAKLALETISWQQLAAWLPVGYLLFSAVMQLTGVARLPFNSGAAWAILTSFLGSSAVVMLFFALRHGDASRIVPMSSAYPVMTLAASAIFLSERITPTRVIGTACVIIGLFVVSR